ncbi:MAG TPA: hypothetical protein VFE12_08730 [Acetobacteraceae bacterium]|jgi:hypothetical protein|nr:hypothetical protein [Acetobacteraceae bacterium]
MRHFAFLAVLALGCHREPPAGAVVQELNNVWYYTLFCNITGGASDLGGSHDLGTQAVCTAALDLGTTTARTCFIAGIRGNLGPTSAVTVSQSSGEWWLNISNSHGNAVAADATCISTAKNRTSEFVQVGNGSTTIAAGITGNRRCYLTRVESNAGTANAFSQTSDRVRVIRQTDATWELNVTQGTGANATVGATCVDTTAGVGFGLEDAPDPGVISDNADSNIASDACALRGIGGHFTTNDTNDGARIEPLGSTPDLALGGGSDLGGGNNGAGWWAEAHNGKRAWWSCVN